MRAMKSAREKDVRWFAQTHLVEDTVFERNVRVCVPPRPRGIIRTSLSHSTGSVTFFNFDFVVVSGCSLDAGAAACPSPSAAVRAMTVGVRCALRVRPQPILMLLSFCCCCCCRRPIAVHVSHTKDTKLNRQPVHVSACVQQRGQGGSERDQGASDRVLSNVIAIERVLVPW
jgi:hypothetical protein